MRLLIAAVGRLKAGAERTLVDRYLARLKAARGAAIGPAAEHELPESRLGSVELRRANEAQRLLAASSDAAWRIALDERGRALSSREFARMLGQRRDSRVPLAAFLV